MLIEVFVTSYKDEPGKPYRGSERRAQPYNTEDDDDHRPQLLKIALRELSDRAVRRDVVKIELLGGSVWDLLLELYVARYRREQIASSGLSVMTGIPLTTTLRYLKILETKNFLERYDIDDGRVNAVKLSDNGVDKINDYFLKKTLAKI